LERKNERSKMSLAASKAWVTRRLNVANSSKKNEKQKEKKKERKFEDSGKDKDVELKADVQREMKALNGVELDQIAKETQKRLDRREAMFNAKNGLNGKAKTRAVIVGKIIKKARIERFNGGVKFSGVVK
jgi:hypothetical protein